jgi:hypothetical protein
MVLDGVGREALLDVAADAVGTRVLALGQLALAVAFGLQGGGTGLAVRDPQVVSLAGRN